MRGSAILNLDPRRAGSYHLNESSREFLRTVLPSRLFALINDRSCITSKPARSLNSNVSSKNSMIRDHHKSSVKGKIVSILLYILICAVIGYFAFTLLDRHVSTHRVPSAFGYEYLAVLLPFLAALISFPFWPLIIYAISRFLFNVNQLRMMSPSVLAFSTMAYGAFLLVTGFFFAWARQQ